MRDELSTKICLNLAVAKKILAAAQAEAVRNGWAVCIAVVDDAGRLVCFERMDGTTNSAADIAVAKARHAANDRRDTSFHENLLTGGNDVVLALPNAMPLEGGLRLLVDELVIGGIGVSGVQSPQDGQIAKAGADLLVSAAAC